MGCFWGDVREIVLKELVDIKSKSRGSSPLFL
jgi:hypothetical protein